jgi:DNA primase
MSLAASIPVVPESHGVFWESCLFPALGAALADDRGALVQQIKAANDIVDVVGSYIALRPAGPTFKGLCPFHDDSRPSLVVDPRRQSFRCWPCGKHGDVIDFVLEQERITFPEALELLARRAGISFKKGSSSPHGQSRAFMLDVMRWAAQQFQQCLLGSPLAEQARAYLAERQLTSETISRFGLGFAPGQWEWLTQRAAAASLSAEILEKVGLIGKRKEGRGYYDRFRDRVMFPIRDMRGQTVGFGGRVLPSSPSAAEAAKYYNSSETVLFSKSENLYGIDLARDAAVKAGYLAVVEGYTDVLMAHQAGIAQVVATMGTALNERHIQQVRRLVNKVILVFDADEGGDTGVDRALEVFVKSDMELLVARLPEGLDPCDLLAQKGPGPFQSALTEAADVLEYKLNRVWSREGTSVEGRRRAIDAVLGIVALAPEARTLKLELIVNRIAVRAGLKEEILWTRLRELRNEREARERPRTPGQPTPEQTQETRQAPAARHEIELMEVLLAEPGLVGTVRNDIDPERIEHPGIRRLLEGLYDLHEEGLSPDLDHLRPRIDNPRLLAKAREWQELGQAKPDRQAYWQEVRARFRQLQAQRLKRDLQTQLHAAGDHDAAVEVLRRLQNETRELS